MLFFSSAASELYSFYHSPKPYTVLVDGLQALEALQERNICVGAISNFDNRLHDIIPGLGIKKYLNFVITSEDAKSSKPESKIFEMAEKQSSIANLRPNQILHIGDDLDNDYYGALNMCWHSLLVDRWGGGYTLLDEDKIIENIMDIFHRKSF